MIIYNLYFKDLSPASLAIISGWPVKLIDNSERTPRNAPSSGDQSIYIATSLPTPRPHHRRPHWGRHRRRESRQCEQTAQDHTLGTIVPIDYHPGGRISDPRTEPARKKPKESRVLLQKTKRDISPDFPRWSVPDFQIKKKNSVSISVPRDFLNYFWMKKPLTSLWMKSIRYSKKAIPEACFKILKFWFWVFWFWIDIFYSWRRVCFETILWVYITA